MATLFPPSWILHVTHTWVGSWSSASSFSSVITLLPMLRFQSSPLPSPPLQLYRWFTTSQTRAVFWSPPSKVSKRPVRPKFCQWQWKIFPEFDAFLICPQTSWAKDSIWSWSSGKEQKAPPTTATVTPPTVAPALRPSRPASSFPSHFLLHSPGEKRRMDERKRKRERR